MDVPRPVLMLVVPPDWDPVPDALADLRRCLSDDYGAVLMLRQGTRPMRSPLILCVGYWPTDLKRFAERDLRPRIAEAFVDLSWVEFEDVG
ncbi:hypothetical protein HNQ07_000623 [Deinococcus metalli]|uniref:Uncharacterized protein n=1 Tax=Deinococcus metalli TaxID=1141878 RepID=A0A7W8KER1_9DEIO|nr:hypothetical protein [Deinococcus metalli]MBB5375179.1 hypothetical protein [Deinococcus metalli]GHF31155.1 hypothetical protein GCM10017781_04190 [Deinococcus metalli]